MDARTLKDLAADAFRTGSYDRAAELYAEITYLEPLEAQHLIKLGDAHCHAGSTAAAIAAYRRALRLLQSQQQTLKAIAVGRAILDLDSTDVEALDELSELAREDPYESEPAAGSPFDRASFAASFAPLPRIGRDGSAPDAPLPATPRAIPVMEPLPPAVARDRGRAEEVLRLARRASETTPTPVAAILAQPVRAESLPFHPVLRATPHTDAPNERPAVQQAAIPLLTDVSPQAFREVLRHVEVTRFRADTPILLAGTRGTSLYILASGVARVVKSYGTDDEENLSLVKEGAFFGEISLLTNAPRTASVVAVEDCVVFTLSSGQLERLTREFPGVQRALLRFYRERLVASVIAGSPLFQHVPRTARPRLAGRFEVFSAEKDTVLIAEGQRAQGLFLLMLGDALVTQLDVDGSQAAIAVMHEGDVLGEMSLVTHRAVSATVTTLRRSMFLFLPRASFAEVMAEFPGARETVQQLSDTRQRLDVERQMEEGVTVDLS